MISALPDIALPIADTQLCWTDQLPDSLENATKVGAYMCAKPGELLISFPQLARYRVSHGKRIDVALLPGGTPDEAIFFLMATPFGALIHQRGELPLHASAVVPPGGSRALLIAGKSGAGKSTTAAALAQRGWTVLNDDVSRITISNGEALAWPGFAKLKLWKQSCDLLRLDSAALPCTRGVKEKFFWQATENAMDQSVMHLQPVPIAAIVELIHEENSSEAPTVSRLRGTAVIQMLVRHTFRPRLIQPLGCKISHFAHLQQSGSKLPCYRVDNSHSLTPDALADRLAGLPDLE